jgi:hypothetical protein
MGFAELMTLLLPLFNNLLGLGLKLIGSELEPSDFEISIRVKTPREKLIEKGLTPEEADEILK